VRACVLVVVSAVYLSAYGSVHRSLSVCVCVCVWISEICYVQIPQYFAHTYLFFLVYSIHKNNAIRANLSLDALDWILTIQGIAEATAQVIRIGYLVAAYIRLVSSRLH